MNGNTRIDDTVDKILDALRQRIKDVITHNIHKIDRFHRPLLRWEAYVDDELHACEERDEQRSLKIASINLRASAEEPETGADASNSIVAVELEHAASSARPSHGDNANNVTLPHKPGRGLKRKAVGGLRPARAVMSEMSEDGSESESEDERDNGQQQQPEQQQQQINSTRRLQSDVRSFPQRRKQPPKKPSLKPSTLDKLIQGVWEQIYGSIRFDPRTMFDQYRSPRAIEDGDFSSSASSLELLASMNDHQNFFNRMTKICSQVTQATRCFRSLEVVVQAHWISCYDNRVHQLLEQNPGMIPLNARRWALLEACKDFGWTEKHLQNRMAIWRGYREIREAAGWVTLVFSGMGIYRFCKYRVDFSHEAIMRLNGLRSRFEVAADTLHPRWRQLLSIIGEPTSPRFTGHPHDWVIADDEEPLPLRRTYQQWDPNFSYEHIEQCVLDKQLWSNSDPRKITVASTYSCPRCGEVQSDKAEQNYCKCFPNLYGNQRGPWPVQIYRTADGRNNGLIACLPLERGEAIGEFVGLVTRGVQGVDVMQGGTDATAAAATAATTTRTTNANSNSNKNSNSAIHSHHSTPSSPTTAGTADSSSYQIWQGRQGNHTRFVNHSCHPNSQYERFVWLGQQRIVLVSKGIDAGSEITVDYSDHYWSNLDKKCLCGESCCRFKDRAEEGQR